MEMRDKFHVFAFPNFVYSLKQNRKHVRWRIGCTRSAYSA